MVLQSRNRERVLHFVGIGGIGMSGIAEVFLNQGFRISGSDLAVTDISQRLVSLGVKIFTGHRAENVHGATVVVISSAIRPENPEVLEAKRLRIPVIPRAEMLGELMRGKTGIAVAGTHGKTTTTSMLATVLTHAGLDPTLVIGGKVDSLGGNAKLGQGQYVVAEADESDGSFVHLPATFGVITNIDNDHMDYFGSLTSIEDTFVEFVGGIPFYGAIAVCADDPGVKRCLERFTKPIVTYGFLSEWDYSAADVELDGLGSKFSVRVEGGKKELGRLELQVPGKHNVLNALAVTATALKLEVPFEKIAKGLHAFSGVKRRFEVRWQDLDQRRVLIDDYGHHPTEILATLEAARSYWPGRILTVFQPHRYSRTFHCRDGFLSAFRQTDLLVITDIYAAGEDSIEGVTAENLVRDLQRAALPHQEVIYAGSLESARDIVAERVSDGDLVLCMGAGSITRLVDQLLPILAQKTRASVRV